MACSLAIGSSAVQAATPQPAASGGKVVEAIPETNFSATNSISLFDSIVTEGYAPAQLTLKSGNGVADFVQKPGYIQDAPPWYFTPNSSQIAADGSTSYTKFIPFNKSFAVHFEVSLISPSSLPAMGPYGGSIFELHDTDPVFAKYGDPAPAYTHLDESYGTFALYVNGKAVWTAPSTVKAHDTFELSGITQSDISTVNNGKLQLKHNGVVVANVTGPNCHGMTPTYPTIPGQNGMPDPLGPAPYPLVSGPHVRLGLGRVPSPQQNGTPVTTEVYIDNVRAIYRD